MTVRKMLFQNQHLKKMEKEVRINLPFVFVKKKLQFKIFLVCVCARACVYIMYNIHVIIISIVFLVTLFVGNLSFDCDEDAMMSFFNEGGFNPHQVRVITRDGRSKG